MLLEQTPALNMADTDEFLIYVKWAESLYLPQGKQTVPLEVTHSTPLTEVKSQSLRLFGHPEKPGGGYDLEYHLFTLNGRGLPLLNDESNGTRI